MSTPTISRLDYCTCLTISLPPPPCPSVVQFQHSCETDSFKRESEHVFPPLRTLQGSSCQRTSPSPYLDHRALALAVPSAWNSCPDTYRAHSILKSLLKRPLSKAYPDHPVKSQPLCPLLPPALPVLSYPALVFLFSIGFIT